MISITVRDEGAGVSIGLNGSLCDISADLLVGLTVLYEEVEKKFDTDTADTFLEMLKENIHLCSKRSQIEKALDGNEEDSDKIEALIHELKGFQNKLERFLSDDKK